MYTGHVHLVWLWLWIMAHFDWSFVFLTSNFGATCTQLIEQAMPAFLNSWKLTRHQYARLDLSCMGCLETHTWEVPDTVLHHIHRICHFHYNFIWIYIVFHQQRFCLWGGGGKKEKGTKSNSRATCSSVQHLTEQLLLRSNSLYKGGKWNTFRSLQVHYLVRRCVCLMVSSSCFRGYALHVHWAWTFGLIMVVIYSSILIDLLFFLPQILGQLAHSWLNKPCLHYQTFENWHAVSMPD